MTKTWALLKEYGYMAFMTVYLIWASSDNIHSEWFRFACGIIVFYWVVCLLNLWATWYNAKLQKELVELQAKRDRLVAEREQLNALLFERFGKYTNEYGYGKSQNSEFSR
jgi:hypothetical protein